MTFALVAVPRTEEAAPVERPTEVASGWYHRLLDLAGAGPISGTAAPQVAARVAQGPTSGSSPNVTSTSALAEI
jgi:hypothetical protein